MISGLTKTRDRSDPFNEAFSFASLEEYERFKVVRPELFDPDASPRDLAERWKKFARTSEGRALRWR
jgi:hypothetical protein